MNFVPIILGKKEIVERVIVIEETFRMTEPSLLWYWPIKVVIQHKKRCSNAMGSGSIVISVVSTLFHGYISSLG